MERLDKEINTLTPQLNRGYIMKVDGKDIRPIWLDEDLKTVKIIDQRVLPHKFVISDLKTVDNVVTAIKEMYVRGAPLIGVTGAYGVYLATLNSPAKNVSDAYLKEECNRLKSARPTAVNLVWGVDKVLSAVLGVSGTSEKIDTARKEAGKIAEDEVESSAEKKAKPSTC